MPVKNGPGSERSKETGSFVSVAGIEVGEAGIVGLAVSIFLAGVAVSICMIVVDVAAGWVEVDKEEVAMADGLHADNNKTKITRIILLIMGVYNLIQKGHILEKNLVVHKYVIVRRRQVE